MTYSMTGFARAETREEWGELVWEIRSVNHRYLETAFRMPEEWRILETRCHELATRRISRGKLDCTLRFRHLIGGHRPLKMDTSLATQLISLCSEIDTNLDNPATPSALQIMQWPGVIKETELEMDSVTESVLELFTRTLDKLTDMRSTEGKRLQCLLLRRCNDIEATVQNIRQHRPQAIDNIREKLNQRLRDLTEKPDWDRLEQELVLQAQKLDIDEELDRLESHLAEVRDVLQRDEPVGRRLDFLMQELNREANTLGSKSFHAETTRASIDLKVLIEQMREQIQNIE